MYNVMIFSISLSESIKLIEKFVSLFTDRIVVVDRTVVVDRIVVNDRRWRQRIFTEI